MVFEQVLPYIPSLLLHFVRTGAFFMALQLFGTQGDSKMFRLILSISLGSIFWWVDDDKLMLDVVGNQNGLDAVRSGGWLAIGVMTALDAVVGLIAGFAMGLVTQAMAIAGTVMSHDMGFAMSQMMDPITGRNHAVMSQFFQSMVVLLMFSMNLHHEFIRVLAATYEHIPVGQGFNITVVFERLSELLTFAIHSGLRYAFPIMGVLVLLTAVLVMLARAVQNINLMEFSFGLRIVLALVASIFFLAEGMPFLRAFGESVVVSGKDLFVGAQ